MFQIGDKVVYPMHGAGIIEAIEEREVLGDKQQYYLMNIKNMQVMFPIGAKTGIRHVVDADIMEDVLTSFNIGESESISNPTLRYRSNMKKMKNGNIYEGAQVIRDLTRMGKKRNLASGDRTMLANAQHMFISELVLVKDIAEDQALNLLNEVINK